MSVSSSDHTLCQHIWWALSGIIMRICVRISCGISSGHKKRQNVNSLSLSLSLSPPSLSLSLSPPLPSLSLSPPSLSPSLSLSLSLSSLSSHKCCYQVAALTCAVSVVSEVNKVKAVINPLKVKDKFSLSLFLSLSHTHTSTFPATHLKCSVAKLNNCPLLYCPV